MSFLSKTPRASIVIAGHNEGELLLKTVESCLENTSGLGFEVVIADDASTDGSAQAVLRRHPHVRLVSHPQRRGTSPTKDLGARSSRGDVIIFIDAHCKPEPWSIEILVNDAEEWKEDAIFTPRVPSLDCERWENDRRQVGYGYTMSLDKFECSWIGLDAMKRRDRYYESPAFVGCCFALTRRLYEKLGGLDPDMIEWGVEDIDLGLRAWLMGHAVLHDPFTAIGHRFRTRFDTFTVTSEGVLVNQIRMARKNYTEPVWAEWLEIARQAQSPEVWERAWALFLQGRPSADRERAYLLGHRVHDEHWYAERFGLNWPRLSEA